MEKLPETCRESVKINLKKTCILLAVIWKKTKFDFDIFGLMLFDSVKIGNILLTFWNKLLFSSSRIMQFMECLTFEDVTDRFSRNVGEHPTVYTVYKNPEGGKSYLHCSRTLISSNIDFV